MTLVKETVESNLKADSYARQVKNLIVSFDGRSIAVAGTCKNHYIKQMVTQVLITTIKKLGLSSTIILKNEILVDA